MTFLLELIVGAVACTLMFGSTVGWAAFWFGVVVGAVNAIFGIVRWTAVSIFVLAVCFAIGAGCEFIVTGLLWR